MGVKKFIKNVIENIGIANFELKNKKKSLKELLIKLKQKRVAVLKELKNDLDEKEEQRLQEELELLSLHIRKAKKRLNSL